MDAPLGFGQIGRWLAVTWLIAGLLDLGYCAYGVHRPEYAVNLR
ncbi:hypothetical protein [Saccharothrix sp. NRRL B-16348]|nr:hypothetical protein [Saccharothrix sp. NRRL B-16348]